MSYILDRGYDLEMAKIVCLGELEALYGGVTLDVFDNDTLGNMYRYCCSESDQLRMINGKVSNIAMTLMCGLVPATPGIDPVYQWVEHASAECGKVHTAYVMFTKSATLAYHNLITQINAAATVEAVDTIWDSIRATLGYAV